MHKIYKYTLPVADYFFLDLPKGARIISIQEQHGQPVMWAIVNPKNPVETRRFKMVDTGEIIGENLSQLDFIATFQSSIENYVGHVFEVR